MAERADISTGALAAPPQQEYALVRVGGVQCAMPHGEPAAGDPVPGRFLLRRIVPWRPPTPLPGAPSQLVLGVAPLGDEEGIEHVEVVVDLARALDIPPGPRSQGACILIYDDGDLTAGFVADALLRRARLAALQRSVDLPFVQALALQPLGQWQDGTAGAAPGGPYEEWRVVDVNAIMQHLIAVLKVPGAA